MRALKSMKSGEALAQVNRMLFLVSLKQRLQRQQYTNLVMAAILAGGFDNMVGEQHSYYAGTVFFHTDRLCLRARTKAVA